MLLYSKSSFSLRIQFSWQCIWEYITNMSTQWPSNICQADPCLPATPSIVCHGWSCTEWAPHSYKLRAQKLLSLHSFSSTRIHRCHSSFLNIHHFCLGDLESLHPLPSFVLPPLVPLALVGIWGGKEQAEAGVNWYAARAICMWNTQCCLLAEFALQFLERGKHLQKPRRSARSQHFHVWPALTQKHHLPYPLLTEHPALSPSTFEAVVLKPAFIFFRSAILLSSVLLLSPWLHPKHNPQQCLAKSGKIQQCLLKDSSYFLACSAACHRALFKYLFQVYLYFFNNVYTI